MKSKISYKFQQDLFNDSWEIRKKVFMDEQGFHDELEEKDHRCFHLVMYCDGKPIGNSRIEILDKNTCQIGRVAIIKEFRGQNYGNDILKKTEQIVNEKFSVHTVYLDAQEDKIGFYLKNGYQRTNNPVFLEEHCPHVKMYKKI